MLDLEQVLLLCEVSLLQRIVVSLQQLKAFSRIAEPCPGVTVQAPIVL